MIERVEEDLPNHPNRIGEKLVLSRRHWWMSYDLRVLGLDVVGTELPSVGFFYLPWSRMEMKPWYQK